MSEVMRQEAPYPDLLAMLVDALRYKPGWLFRLSDLDRAEPWTR